MSKVDPPEQLNRLWNLLDQEVEGYQCLLQDVRQEWECLNKEDPSLLSSLLQAKAAHIDQINKVRESLNEILFILRVGAAPLSRKSILDLIPHLPCSQADQIRNYQRRMNRLRKEILRVNERNKRFVQEVLDYLKDLFSLLLSPNPEGPVYLKNGASITSSPVPCWMNKEV